ncbi:MAG: BolA family protein [Myxococcota bacterium]|nr:BolA family protein [Myxococcota bacterium]
MGMLGTGGTLTDAVRAAIIEAIPEAEVEVNGSGGHFTIRVVSSIFEGKSMLQKQRLVMKAVAPFMAGDDAPVHAIDNLQTLLPE